MIFGNRFYGFRKPAFARIGKVFDKPVDMITALNEADINFRINKKPLFIEGFNIPTDMYAIVRQELPDDPIERVFGFCKGNYSIIQNYEIAEILNPLTETYPVECVGTMKYGLITFFVLRSKNININGDELISYHTCIDVKDGKTSLRIISTPVRIECMNSFVIALKKAYIDIPIRHKGKTPRDLLNLKTKLVAQMKQVEEEVAKLFNEWSVIKITDDLVNEIINKIHEIPNKPSTISILDEITYLSDIDEFENLIERANKSKSIWELNCEIIKEKREMCLQNYVNFCNSHQQFANTLWALYNAITEISDWGGKDRSDANISAMIGNRSKEKAKTFNVIYKFYNSLLNN